MIRPRFDSAESDSGEAAPGDLAFRWHQSAPRWHLLFFLIVAAAIHIGFFYLFRVASPQPARTIPSPEQITLLIPSNPEARPILAQIADRVSPFVAGDSRTVDLADHSTQFVPSFRNFTLSLRMPPESREPAELPPLSQPGTAILPPLALAAPNAAAGGSSRPDPRLKLGGGLAGRQILRVPAWDNASLAALPECRFQFSAGFDHLGRPVFILPRKSPGNPTSPETVKTLTAALKSLRLDPATSSASGVFEVIW